MQRLVCLGLFGLGWGLGSGGGGIGGVLFGGFGGEGCGRRVGEWVRNATKKWGERV